MLSMKEIVLSIVPPLEALNRLAEVPLHFHSIKSNNSSTTIMKREPKNE